MSFKRARTLEQIGGSVTIDAEQEPEDAEYREAAGKRFRQYLLDWRFFWFVYSYIEGLWT